jgi:hypothetical protein
MAGVAIARTVSFSLRQKGARGAARRNRAPIAGKAEMMVCRGLGIVQDGEEITAKAMDEFARRFQGRVPDDVLGAMRALFKLDDFQDEATDEALIGHGGAAAMDQDLFVADGGEDA